MSWFLLPYWRKEKSGYSLSLTQITHTYVCVYIYIYIYLYLYHHHSHHYTLTHSQPERAAGFLAGAAFGGPPPPPSALRDPSPRRVIHVGRVGTTRSLTHPLTPLTPLTHSTHPLHPLHPLTHSLTHSLPHSLHSLTLSTHSLSHSLTHSTPHSEKISPVVAEGISLVAKNHMPACLTVHGLGREMHALGLRSIAICHFVHTTSILTSAVVWPVCCRLQVLKIC